MSSARATLRPGRSARWWWAGLAAAVAVGLVPSGAAAAATDRHAGYYYPEPASSESYALRVAPLPDANRKRRVLFVTEMTNQMLASPYPPPFAIFAKGEEAEKLIITALYRDGYDTLYRLRALLAMLTARARATPLFRELQIEDMLTFFDLLGMLGFEQVTVTDGDRLAHRILLE